MDKLKKIWGENKVLFVLAMILVICLGVLVGVAIVYGYGTNDSNYETPAKIENGVLSNVVSTLKANEKVTDATATLKRKTVYITIKYSEGTTLDEAKLIAATAIPLFDDNTLKEADLSFTIIISGNNSITLWGAKNTHGSGDIVWGNYNIKNTSEKEKESN